MKLTDQEKEAVQATLASVGWQVFEKFIEQEIKHYSDLDVPDGIASFFEREQQLGKLETLRTLVSGFKTSVT